MAGKIRHGYQFWETVGTGTWAKVKRVVRVADGSEFAAKIFYHCTLQRKLKGGHAKVASEFQMMHRLPPHPNVLAYHDLFHDDDKVYMIVDLCQLSLEQVVKNRMEISARDVLRQLLSGLQHLHAHGISHHDIKPANIMLSRREDSAWTVKICDFGIAEQEASGHCVSCFGTPAFQAPEIVNFDPLAHPDSHYDGFAADVWSAGCLAFYVTTGGELLFPECTTVYEQLKVLGQATDPLPQLPRVPNPQQRHFVATMLVVDVAKRSTIPQLLAHPLLRIKPQDTTCCAIS